MSSQMGRIGSRRGVGGSTRLFDLLVIFLLSALALSGVPLGAVHAQTQSSVTTNSVDQNTNPVSGYWVVLFDSSGNNVGDGRAHQNTFAVTVGSAYTVQAYGYGNCTFHNWPGSVSSKPMPFTATSGALSFTATFSCVGSIGGTSGKITVYDHRLTAPYWAPCFATVCSAGTGPGASMWVALYDSSGTMVASGFADENGHTFTGLNPSATYYLYPADCDLCHGSTHDVVFDHWGSGSSTRPLAVVANSASVNAWYACTNGCTGY